MIIVVMMVVVMDRNVVLDVNGVLTATPSRET